MADGAPSATAPSHRDGASRSPPPVRSYRDFFKNIPDDSARIPPGKDCLEDLAINLPFREATLHTKSDASAIPAICFSKEEVHQISAPFKLCLVFKFYRDHPPLEDIKKTLKERWMVSQPCSAMHIDRRHVLLRFASTDDFLKAWTRETWAMLGQSLKIFRWTPWFKPGLESPLVPLWFSLPHLPACLFGAGSLASIASGLGRLLRIGPATQRLGRVEAARICIEVDVSKSIPSELWIALGEEGFIQDVIPDFMPFFCLSCRKHHSTENCIVGKENSSAPPANTDQHSTPAPDKADHDEGFAAPRRRRRNRWTPVKAKPTLKDADAPTGSQPEQTNDHDPQDAHDPCLTLDCRPSQEGMCIVSNTGDVQLIQGNSPSMQGSNRKDINDMSNFASLAVSTSTEVFRTTPEIRDPPSPKTLEHDPLDAMKNLQAELKRHTSITVGNEEVMQHHALHCTTVGDAKAMQSQDTSCSNINAGDKTAMQNHVCNNDVGDDTSMQVSETKLNEGTSSANTTDINVEINTTIARVSEGTKAIMSSSQNDISTRHQYSTRASSKGFKFCDTPKHKVMGDDLEKDAELSALQSQLNQTSITWKQEMEHHDSHVETLQEKLLEVKASIHSSEDIAKKELELLWRRVRTTATLLAYLKSKARIIAVPHLAHTSCGIKHQDGIGLIDKHGTPLSDWSKNIDLSSFENSNEEVLLMSSNRLGLLDANDGTYISEVLKSIQLVTDVMEALVKRVIMAETEAAIGKEKLNLGQEEIRKKALQIEIMSGKVREMEKFALGTNSILNEMRQKVEDMVQETSRQRLRASENEQELCRVKQDFESLKSYVSSLIGVREALLPSDQLQSHENLLEMIIGKATRLQNEKSQKEAEVQELMAENVRLNALLDKKEAQLLALNEQCKFMALSRP